MNDFDELLNITINRIIKKHAEMNLSTNYEDYGIKIIINDKKYKKNLTSSQGICDFLFKKNFRHETSKARLELVNNVLVRPYFSFGIAAFYNNCGAVIINNICIHSYLTNKTIFKMAISISKKLGYGIAMYSHFEKGILNSAKENGMKKICEFINPRSNRKLEILNIKL